MRRPELSRPVFFSRSPRRAAGAWSSFPSIYLRTRDPGTPQRPCPQSHWQGTPLWLSCRIRNTTLHVKTKFGTCDACANRSWFPCCRYLVLLRSRLVGYHSIKYVYSYPSITKVVSCYITQETGKPLRPFRYTVSPPCRFHVSSSPMTYSE